MTRVQNPQRAAYLAWWHSFLHAQVFSLLLHIIINGTPLGNFGFSQIKNQLSKDNGHISPFIRKWKQNLCVALQEDFEFFLNFYKFHKPGVNALCFPGAATIYARYKFVEKLSEETRGASPFLNTAALVVGMVSCLGMCIVATFQVRVRMWSTFWNTWKSFSAMLNGIFSSRWFQETTVTVAHDIGALLFFVSGVVYTILQSIISYRACPSGSSINLCRARLSITVIATMAFFPSILLQTSIHQEMHLFLGVLSIC